MDTPCPASSDAITTLAEALVYYQSKLARSHTITCQGQRVQIVFERDGTHLFSEEVADIEAIPTDQLVTRDKNGGKRECRQFCLERAKLMDQVLPAISKFTRCVGGAQASNRRPKLVHGPKMPCGRYMRVVLRHGPGKSWVVVTAFPISELEYRKASWSEIVQFP